MSIPTPNPTVDNYLDALNDSQRAAVSYLDGPSLVIAGAGSGKTRVLTYKIVHLLANSYEPWRILALTFTNKAAREMRERIEALVGQATASKLWMGTFHSIFARILRANASLIGFKSNFTIYDSADSRSLVKTIIKEMGLDDKIYKPSAVISAISAAKNALISPAAYALDRDIIEADRHARRPELYRVYENYCHRCFVAGAMDFDDLLYYTNVLLRDNPDLLNHYRQFFRYVLVDEYQDTNFAQHLIVRRLTEGIGDLTVVGDDAQSIYSFRGANIRNIIDLRKSYPDLRVFKLEQNYRSTRRIIEAANSLIAKNTVRIPKEVFTTGDDGDHIEVVGAFSDYEEAYLVANRIVRQKMRSGDPYNEFAILYRTNAQSRILEEALRKCNIPYRIYGGLSFYSRKEVKDAVSYLRLAINPDDDEALRRIINFPQRGIGDTTLARLTRAALDRNISIWAVINSLADDPAGLNRGAITKVNNFAALISSFAERVNRGDSAYDITADILARSGMMTLYISDTTPESVSRRENLEELLGAVRTFVDTRTESGEADTSLASFMSEVSLATDQDSDDTAGDDRVTLMTAHAAKGLEFSNVFVVGVEEDLFPSAMAGGDLGAVEEERRLLYVAITRAKRFAMLSYAKSRFRNGQTCTCSPSRFFRDIGTANLRFTMGTDVTSARPAPRRFSADAADAATAATTPRRSTIPARPAASHSPAATAAPKSKAAAHTVNELDEGMTIAHPVFGRGTITAIDTSMADPRIIVNFDGPGRKVLLLKFARFDIIDN